MIGSGASAARTILVNLAMGLRRQQRIGVEMPVVDPRVFAHNPADEVVDQVKAGESSIRMLAASPVTEGVDRHHDMVSGGKLCLWRRRRLQDRLRMLRVGEGPVRQTALLSPSAVSIRARPAWRKMPRKSGRARTAVLLRLRIFILS
jgi:hypothetical protein